MSQCSIWNLSLVAVLVAFVNPLCGGQTTPTENGEGVATKSASANRNDLNASSAKAAANGIPIDLTIPAGASLEKLESILAAAKKFQPQNPSQMVAVHAAIRDASNGVIELLKDENLPRFQEARLDSSSSSITLMATESADGIARTRTKIHEYLQSKKSLSLADLQMGIIAATFLEMQPNKAPAKDTYNLMIDMLAEDKREEMQSLRQNLMASVRRLELLGNKLQFKANAIDGRQVSIDQYAGKFVIVDFFATWCEPCVAEIPRIKGHWDKYHSRGLEVVSISIDKELDDLKKYLAEKMLPWPVVHDVAENPFATLQMKFGVATLPMVLLLNKEGVVVSLEARGPELDRLMQRIFEQPTVAVPTPAPPVEKSK